MDNIGPEWRCSVYRTTGCFNFLDSSDKRACYHFRLPAENPLKKSTFSFLMKIDDEFDRDDDDPIAMIDYIYQYVKQYIFHSEGPAVKSLRDWMWQDDISRKIGLANARLNLERAEENLREAKRLVRQYESE